MAGKMNGQPGKKVSEQIKQRGISLLKQGLSAAVVSQRLNVSKSLVRNWQRETQGGNA